MKKVLMALLDKRRALKSESDVINSAIDKASGEITAEQEQRMKALQDEGSKVIADMEALAASLPDDPEKTQADAVAAAVTAAVAIKETRAVDANIAAACNIARQPAKASAFITEGKPLADVAAALQAGKVEGSGAEISHHGDGGSNPVQIAKDWDDAADKANAMYGFKRG
jgi:Arc/MetJ-type ribon-helix-helix transcriptional regulator